MRFDGRDITTLDEDELRPHALGRHLRGLPVEHELAEPGDHRSGAVRRRVRRAPRCGGAGGRPRPAGRRPARDGLAVARRAAPLPARAVRRHEAAGGAGAGARPPAEVRAARRAHDRARRRGPARDPGPARRAARRARLRGAVHQPRPRHRHGDGGPGDGDVRRRDRRGPAGRRHASTNHHHPYTAGLLGSYADPRDEVVEVAFIPGRPPDLSRRARRLPVRAALPGRGGGLPHRAPRAAHRPAEAPLAACSWRPRPRGAPRPAAVARLEQLDAVFAADAHARGDADDEPVLVVDDVSKAYRVRRNRKTTITQAVRRRVVRAAPRAGQRAGRPERLRQDHDGPAGHRRGATRPAAGSGSRTPRSTSWAGAPCGATAGTSSWSSRTRSRRSTRPAPSPTPSAGRCATTWAWTSSRPASARASCWRRSG